MHRRRARRAPRPFTAQLPEPLPAERSGDAWVVESDGHQVRLTNLDRVLWPQDGYTKGDLLAYYWNVAPLIVPHLRRRPLTMRRMPEGVAGPFFFEKAAPREIPPWVKRCDVPRSDGRDIPFLTIDDRASLLYAANLGCIEMHPLHARCGRTDTPDYLFFDLDPFGPFEDVLAVALHVRAALTPLGLEAYPKTSGATGMQIFVPIEPRWSFEDTRAFVEAIGRMILAADPDRATMRWRISERTGKVFIDHNMNRAGANIAAVYSVRPEPQATVSTPVTWDEVERGLHPSDFTIESIWSRIVRVGDLFAPVRERPQDLGPALVSVLAAAR